MRKKELLSLIAASGLTGSIKEYFTRTAGMKTPSGLKTALRKDPARFIENIESLLAAGGALLGRPKEEVLFITGFNKNDMAPERFEAALAELRAALWLKREGFSCITLLRQGSGTGADLSGTRGGRKYIFEVRCINAGAAPLAYLLKKPVKPGTPSPEAVDYLRLKYEKKIRQVNCTRKKTGSPNGGIIFVLGLDGSAAKSALRDLAAALHLAKNSPPFTNICLLSGETGAVYPAW